MYKITKWLLLVVLKKNIFLKFYIFFNIFVFLKIFRKGGGVLKLEYNSYSTLYNAYGTNVFEKNFA